MRKEVTWNGADAGEGSREDEGGGEGRGLWVWLRAASEKPSAPREGAVWRKEGILLRLMRAEKRSRHLLVAAFFWWGASDAPAAGLFFATTTKFCPRLPMAMGLRQRVQERRGR